MRLPKSPGSSDRKHFLLASVILFALLLQNASSQGLSVEDVELVPLDVEPGALGEDGGVDVFGNLSSGDGEERRGEIRMGVDLEETVEEVPGSRPKEDVEQVGVPETPDVAVNPEPVEPKIESKTQNFEIYDYSNYDCLKTRYAPSTQRLKQGDTPYVITTARLEQIRKEFLYCYFDQGGDDGNGDYQIDIHSSMPQIHKNFNFQLPFYGFRFNYTRLSMNGFLEFSDPPEHYTYPLSFPVKDWPKKNDPAFIGIFFSKTRIGKIRPTDVDQRRPGVYYRVERDLMTRTDQFGVEMRERLMWDIRQGVVGADTFIPKHSVVVTWKNMSFAGGIDNSLYTTNTFQMVLATDEVYTYAIFNYVELNWLSHTEAGGDTTTGSGGVPAFVGFNAGNGTQSHEYKPYSQDSVIRDLTGRGWANNFPGRHIFRIDEKIMLGTCNKDLAGTNLPLVFAPESGNMMGGTIVNITGPCFEKGMKITCRFDTVDVTGTVIDTNRAICVQPFVMAEGYVMFEVSYGETRYNWKGKYFIETPATAIERIRFETRDVHERSPAEIKISWNAQNLTTNLNAPITISLWGYRETTIRPERLYIDVIERSASNTGSYVISPANYRTRNNLATRDLQFGFIMINLTNPVNYEGLTISPELWSRPIPLGWYFNAQWERQYGSRWSQTLCNNWLTNDRYLKNFAADVPQCPCILEHALNDKGRFMPDYDCDKDINRDCFYHRGAMHCVRSGAPSMQGSGQQCCYDKNSYLMLTYDQQWGSRPHRSHNLGYLPWNEANKVPTLSHWFHDMVPYYLCCMWQEEQAVGCETYRFERRPTQDCVSYQAPAVATVFGDPHVVTFDNLEYTFNGKGEFVLVRANSRNTKLDVQGRFEQLPNNFYGEVLATQLTAIAAKDNTSSVIEVRLRPAQAQWRYRLDVFADGRRVYFDRQSLRSQHFFGVTVYTPSHILNQSEVIIMFESGAGVEVVENKGYMSARVYLPWTFINQTRGLFGNWSFDVTDDFTLPNGLKATVGSTSLNNFERVHKDFAINWLLDDKEQENIGAALFFREFGRTSSSFTNSTFVPEYRQSYLDIIPSNRSQEREYAKGLCGDTYQCLFDYALSLTRDLAFFTKQYLDDYSIIRNTNNRRIISCGVLETPRFGRKSNFFFVPGTTVQFECSQDFVLIGDQRRTCMANGQWDLPEYGYTECLRQQEYSSRTMGVTFGIILGVLVPILFLGVWGYFCYVKKSRPVEDGSTSWEYENNIVNRSLGRTPRALSPAKGSSSDSDRSSSGSSSIFGGKRRSYDKVYRTKEPLPNKPLIEFEDKLWDLEEEGPESSLTTTDDTPSDLGRHTRALPGVGTGGVTGAVADLDKTGRNRSPSDLGSPSQLGRTGNTVVNRRAKQTAI